MASSMSDTLAGMLTGQIGFKDGFIGIWNEIMSAFKRVISEMLSSFIEGFIKQALNQLGAFVAKWTSTMAGLPSPSMPGVPGVPGSVPGWVDPLGQVGITLAIFDAILPGDKGFIDALLDFDHPPVLPVSEDEARGAAADYFGPNYEDLVAPDFDWSNVLPGDIPGLESLDVGGHILSDGIAMVHAGETVKPAEVAPYRGGQDQPVVINISAMDGESVQRVVESRDFAEAFARATRVNTFGIGTSMRTAMA
jgi:hypothetical protein